MANKLIIIFYLFLSAICFSQVRKKLTVDYTLYISDQIGVTDSQNSQILKGIVKESGNVYFRLYINDTISYFVENNGISSSNLSTQLAINKSKYSTPIYFNSDKTFIFNNNPNFIFFHKNEFLIRKEQIKNWNITKEKKIIDGKSCYKATTRDYFYNNKSAKIEYEVTAWFCPQIPLNFGPVYYNDLPGLILEISYLNVTLVATKISLELEDKKIIKPYGMNKISIDEYSFKLSDKITEMIEEADIQEGKK